VILRVAGLLLIRRPGKTRVSNKRFRRRRPGGLCGGFQWEGQHHGSRGSPGAEQGGRFRNRPGFISYSCTIFKWVYVLSRTGCHRRWRSVPVSAGGVRGIPHRRPAAGFWRMAPCCWPSRTARSPGIISGLAQRLSPPRETSAAMELSGLVAEGDGRYIATFRTTGRGRFPGYRRQGLDRQPAGPVSAANSTAGLGNPGRSPVHR